MSTGLKTMNEESTQPTKLYKSYDKLSEFEDPQKYKAVKNPIDLILAHRSIQKHEEEEKYRKKMKIEFLNKRMEEKDMNLSMIKEMVDFNKELGIPTKTIVDDLRKERNKEVFLKDQKYPPFEDVFKEGDDEIAKRAILSVKDHTPVKKPPKTLRTQKLRAIAQKRKEAKAKKKSKMAKRKRRESLPPK